MLKCFLKLEVERHERMRVLPIQLLFFRVRSLRVFGRAAGVPGLLEDMIVSRSTSCSPVLVVGPSHTEPQIENVAIPVGKTIIEQLLAWVAASPVFHQKLPRHRSRQPALLLYRYSLGIEWAGDDGQSYEIPTGPTFVYLLGFKGASTTKVISRPQKFGEGSI